MLLPKLSQRLGLHEALILLTLTSVYFLTGKLGLAWAFYHPSATAIWPPTGIAFAGLLTFGYWIWPAIFLGAFLVNVTTAGSLVTSLGIAVGNTLEGVIGALLVTTYCQSPRIFESPSDVFRFVGLAAVLATTISATLGVGVLSLAGYLPWRDVVNVWEVWWLGDVSGALIVAPLLVLWARTPTPHFDVQRLVELGLWAAAFLLVSYAVFGLFWGDSRLSRPLGFLAVPLLVWPAVRFGPRETATAMFALTSLAIWQTINGHGPFASQAPHESVLFLQAFMAILAVMALMLAAAVRGQHNTAAELAAREAQFRHAEAELRALFASMSDVVLVLDNKGQYVKVAPTNPAFLYRPPNELIGKRIHDVLPQDTADAILSHIEKTLTTRTTIRVEYTLSIRGEKVCFDGVVSPIDDTTVLWVARDMTARKHMEEKLQDFTRTLEQRVQERTVALQEANRKLEELNVLKSALVTTVSHELRTPTTSIKGFAENMLDGIAGPLTERQTHYLSRIRQNAVRLSKLLNDVLDVARLESGEARLEREPVVLHELIEEVLENYAKTAAEKSIALKGPDRPQAVAILCDRDKVLRILSNLVDNALKFTPAFGAVTIGLDVHDHAVDVCVQDTGCGIPEHEIEKIFDKFYQAPATTGRTGIGLGLSIVKSLVELHDGTVWVTSDKGTRACFSLPRGTRGRPRPPLRFDP